MLNSLKSHIYTLNLLKFCLVFLLIITQTACEFKPKEKTNQKQEIENKGLNFIITNNLSEFSGSKLIEKEANNFLRQWNLAGMTMSVVKDGKLVYAHGFGYADPESKQPVSPGNLFRIASVSKLITAVAIMNLVEKKAISLNSKVFGPNAILGRSNTVILHLIPRL